MHHRNIIHRKRKGMNNMPQRKSKQDVEKFGKLTVEQIEEFIKQPENLTVERMEKLFNLTLTPISPTLTGIQNNAQAHSTKFSQFSTPIEMNEMIRNQLEQLKQLQEMGRRLLQQTENNLTVLKTTVHNLRAASKNMLKLYRSLGFRFQQTVPFLKEAAESTIKFTQEVEADLESISIRVKIPNLDFNFEGF